MHTTSNLEGSSRPLLAAKNRTLRQQFIQGHKNWTILEKNHVLMNLNFCFNVQVVESKFGIFLFQLFIYE